MAKRKRDYKKKGHTEDDEPVKSGISFGTGMQHFEEPLLIISILTGIIPVIRPFVGGGGVADVLAYMLFLLGLASIYVIYLYFRSGKRTNVWFFGIPLLIFITAICSFQANQYASQGSWNGAFTARDFTVFSIMFGILSLSCALALHKIMKPSRAVILVLFLSTLMIHLAPADTIHLVDGERGQGGEYLAALDPYYYYRHAKTIVETGYIPEHETLIYPTAPPAFSTSPFMVSVLMASLSTVLMQFGLNVHDVAMLYPGVFSAFTVVVFYLLLRDLFSDMKPYNYAAALLGAFMLMLSPSFAAKAIATNCEDDALGMFLLVSSFLLFVVSFRRKSLILALLAGFSFLLLNISWSGYSYAIMVFGVFGVLYAVINFIHKRSCVEHIPYFVIPVFISQLHPLVLHAIGGSPRFFMPPQIVLLPFGAVLLTSFLLEIIRNHMNGEITVDEEGGNKLDSLVQRYASPIGILLVVLTVYYVFMISNPNDVINYVDSLVKGAKQTEIIGMTTAEQKALCSSFNIDCLKQLMNHFGLAVLFGVGMIPMLLYFMVAKRSLGAIFVLTWSLPMIYGVMQKSQYQFTASVPIVALGATIGLVILTNRRDIQGLSVLRVIPTIILIFVPLMFFLNQGGIPFLGAFGGFNSMHMGAGADRIYWNGTLGWLGEQPDSIVVLTWWDYGHWIAAVSDRTSILDNTKANRFMVQDIAKFHVVVENETEALEIARKYGSTHVVIDYTMIGKSGAPHFIATSGLGGYIPFKAIGAKIECVKGDGCDNLMEYAGDDYAYTLISQNGSIVIDFGSEYVINKTQIRLWNLDGRYYRYRIEVSTDGVNWKEVVDKTGGDWSGLQIDSFKDVKSRFVRITGTYASAGNEFRVTGVMVYNPRYEGSGMGYAHCGFTPGISVLEPTLDRNSESGFDLVKEIRFLCNFRVGQGRYPAINFRIKNQEEFNPETDIKLETWRTDGVEWMRESSIPWQTWRDSSGESILGVQSLKDILGNALNYPNNYANFPTFTTLIYVFNRDGYDFNKVMMTKLYLGDYLEEYQNAGLAQSSIEKPEYFKLVEEFRGNKPDESYWGYVRVYEIIYPEGDSLL